MVYPNKNAIIFVDDINKFEVVVAKSNNIKNLQPVLFSVTNHVDDNINNKYVKKPISNLNNSVYELFSKYVGLKLLL